MRGNATTWLAVLTLHVHVLGMSSPALANEEHATSDDIIVESTTQEPTTVIVESTSPERNASTASNRGKTLDPRQFPTAHPGLGDRFDWYAWILWAQRLLDEQILP